METQGTVFKLLGLSLFFAQLASAHPIAQYWQNRMSRPGFSLGPKISLLSTVENYSDSGSTTLIPDALKVNRSYFDLNWGYGFSETLSIFGRISALTTKVDAGGLRDKSNFGFSDQLVGVAYRVYRSENKLNLHLQFDATIPAYSNNVAKQANRAYLGDGSIDLTPGIFAELPFADTSTHEFLAEAGLGYTYRAYGFSSALPWNISIKYEPVQSGLIFGLGMRGNLSFETDKSEAPIAVSDQIMGAGGSFLINAINPTWTIAQASAGYQLSDCTQAILSGSIPMGGENATKASVIALGVNFSLGGSAKAASQANHHSKEKLYDLSGKVTGMNDQLFLVKINLGSKKGVRKGQFFDIFDDDQAIARAKVTHVRDDESALRVVEYYQEQSINTGSVAKRERE